MAIENSFFRSLMKQHARTESRLTPANPLNPGLTARQEQDNYAVLNGLMRSRFKKSSTTTSLFLNQAQVSADRPRAG